MLDLDLILDHTDDVAKRLATKGLDPAKVYLARDSVVRRRQVRTKLDERRSQMNQRSKEMGRLVAAKDPAADVLRAKLAELKGHIAELEEEYRQAEEASMSLLLELPNLPDPQAPIGDDESANVVVRHGGPEAIPRSAARPHWEVAGDLGIFDPERAAKLSGSGFAVLRGDGAQLLRALVSFGLDLHRPTYEELVVPHLVRQPIMVGTGHLPKFADDAYATTLDDFWAVPTGEVPLTALHRDEILHQDDLPRRYMTYTSCFRREAGSAGKDTRGMQRLHEFHKVELVRLCLPDTVEQEFEELLADAERTLQQLQLPYRVVDLATGDLTFSSARIYDLEVYSPGVDRWLEVSSVGNFTDFQARRSNIRVRTESGTRPVYTLNGSGLATPRLWAAIIEHGQMPDGRVRVPDVLRPYLGKDVLDFLPPQGQHHA
ncbi:MAG TPA: serine--tRNA ligase [Pseudonocardiaceae bacterium]|nr:serine--tRNA ligase [Pseudonocardiaceae bacterium]